MVILMFERFMQHVPFYKGTNGSLKHGFETLKIHNQHFNLSATLFFFRNLKKEILNNQSNITPTISIIKSKPTIWSTINCQRSKNVRVN